jgi:hypothetical protein
MSIGMTRLSLDVPLRCRCGHVRGTAREVSPSTGFRFVCYCTDCQAFARFLAHVPENACPRTAIRGWEPPPPSFGVFVRRAAKVFGWWLHGLGRPNPFFDDRTNAPLSPPRVITPSERVTL